MSKYYCLIAGLPNISLDDSKLTYSVSEFRKELDGILTSCDKKLVDLFFLKFDNKNLQEIVCFSSFFRLSRYSLKNSMK